MFNTTYRSVACRNSFDQSRTYGLESFDLLFFIASRFGSGRGYVNMGYPTPFCAQDKNIGCEAASESQRQVPLPSVAFCRNVIGTSQHASSDRSDGLGFCELARVPLKSTRDRAHHGKTKTGIFELQAHELRFVERVNHRTIETARRRRT